MAGRTSGSSRPRPRPIRGVLPGSAGPAARGGFGGHDGYDGTFFALPGGGELELTAGSAAPCPGTDEDLLVLYLRTPEEVQQIAAELESTGVATVPAANPYWDRWGRTLLDPDGYRVVIAAVPPDRAPSQGSTSSSTPAPGRSCAGSSSWPRTPRPSWTPT